MRGSARSLIVSIVALIGLCLFALGSVTTARAEEPTARAWYFYSEYCIHCQETARDVIEPLQAKYGERLEIRRFEVSDEVNYALLLRTEATYPPTKREVPEIVIGGRALGGADEIRVELDSAIAVCLASGGCQYPEVGGPEELAAHAGAQIHLAYFYTLGCAECDRASYDLDYVKARYPGVVITSFDIGTSDNKTLNESLGDKLGVPAEKRLLTPAVFVGNDYLVGHEITAASLGSAVGKYSTSGAPRVWEGLATDSDAAEASIIERFRAFGVAPILLAGLIDGLNPCAFATMIFFVSYLTVAGRRGREILFVGASFTVGVFLAYLLIGLGFLAAVKSLAFLVTAAKAVYLATAVLCLVLAAMNVRDFFAIRRGRLSDMSLQLPGFLKDRIRRVIRERARARNFAIAAFVSGFIISFLELLCTGQVYLPTIVFVVGVPELRLHATTYLVLYNLMFITPLIALFALTYFGTTSAQLTKFLQKRAGLIKLLMAVLFVILGGWLAYSALV